MGRSYHQINFLLQNIINGDDMKAWKPLTPHGMTRSCPSKVHFCCLGTLKMKILKELAQNGQWRLNFTQLFVLISNFAPCQLHCGTYFGTPNFFKLTLSWIWTAGLEENRPVKSQFLFKCSVSTVDSARVDWMYVLARVPPEESRFLRETTQNNLLFPVTVLPTAT